MNGEHRQRDGPTLCLLTNPVSSCNITMVRFDFGDTVKPHELLYPKDTSKTSDSMPRGVATVIATDTGFIDY
ncbi:hypothetical protein TNCV_3528211 [Trichonephila clavipes]|nr:hypothetical protein TNCV_3528211 [Trichonephila clavipes]